MTELDFHQKAYVCTHVLDRERPVLLVSRVDGDWCLLCGDLHDQNANAYRVVGIGHILASDPSLNEVTDLIPDWEAERVAVGDVWVRRPVPEEEEEKEDDDDGHDDDEQ